MLHKEDYLLQLVTAVNVVIHSTDLDSPLILPFPIQLKINAPDTQKPKHKSMGEGCSTALAKPGTALGSLQHQGSGSGCPTSGTAQAGKHPYIPISPHPHIWLPQITGSCQAADAAPWLLPCSVKHKLSCSHSNALPLPHSLTTMMADFITSGTADWEAHSWLTDLSQFLFADLFVQAVQSLVEGYALALGDFPWFLQLISWSGNDVLCNSCMGCQTTPQALSSSPSSGTLLEQKPHVKFSPCQNSLTMAVVETRGMEYLRVAFLFEQQLLTDTWMQQQQAHDRDGTDRLKKSRDRQRVGRNTPEREVVAGPGHPPKQASGLLHGCSHLGSATLGSRNRLHLDKQEHNYCSPWQVFTPQGPKMKVQMKGTARLILPTRSSQEQRGNFKRCKKESQEVESQVPSGQSDPSVLPNGPTPTSHMKLSFPRPWELAWADTTNQTQTSPWMSKQHISQDCWDGARSKFPFQPY
ncbi:hypothetical protein EK904_012052 [Melospiza melodia maxima]|nr:hypothetical protein EK904_012052 [Melospiza melodia maxima]